MRRIYDMLIGKSITNKILLMVFVTVIAFTWFIGTMTYNWMSIALEEEASDKMNEILKQINLNLTHTIEANQNEIKTFLQKTEIEKYLLDLSNNDKPNVNNTSIKLETLAFKKQNDYLIDARVFYKGIKYADSSTYPSEMLLSNPDLYQLDQQDFVWTSVSDQSWNKFAYLPAIYCYTEYPFPDSKKQSVWRFDFSTGRIFESVSSTNFGENGTILILRSNGSLVYFSKDGEVVRNYREITNFFGEANNNGYSYTTINGNEYFISYNRNDSIGWYVVGTVPRSEMQQRALSLRNGIFFLSLLASILLSAVLGFILKIFTKRTQKLSKIIGQFGLGDFTLRYEEKNTKDEIGVLGSQFNQLMDRIQRLMIESKMHYERENALLNQNLTLEIMKKQSELHVLQNQINPHFLFNTLEMLKGMFYEPGSRDTMIQAVQALSDMFRYNLNDQALVALKDEIIHITDYIFIQNMRFDHQIDLDVDISKELLQAKVLRFSLEPLIENSIKHGIRHGDYPMTIRITAKQRGDKVTVSVYDNGWGIQKDKLKELNHNLKENWEHSPAKSIGVFNVNARLRLEYGEGYGLYFESEYKKDTTVYMTIPYSRNEEAT